MESTTQSFHLVVDSTLITSSGDGHSPLWTVVVIQLLVGLLGILGNFLVCFVFLHPRTRRNETNLLITHQAFIDVFSSFLLVAHVLYDLSRYEGSRKEYIRTVRCYIWESKLLLYGSFAVSTFNLVVISLERYVATVHPLSHSRIFTRRNLRCLIATVWVVAPIPQYGIVLKTHSVSDGECIVEWAPAFTGVILFFWEYFIPVSVMSYSFFTIVKRFSELNRVLESHLPLTSVNQSSKSSPADSIIPPATGKNEQMHAEFPLHQQSLHSHHHVDTTSGSSAYSAVLPGAHQAINSALPTAHTTALNSGSVIRKNATKTLIIVYVVYIVCWSPNQWLFFQLNVGGSEDFFYTFHEFSLVLSICNSCVTPFIYALRHNVYRDRVRELFRSSTRCIFRF
ncbi:5-hydroxytryptamine receptor 1 [Holothuria leucospilota]|uniref:5-hydroxytryptamine receptor 1 n=1 Tax=Holothuria leucospilota TaxID=206669 RepID=A0A9Q1BPL2_HOLLE|nr:5-hydroxytryptamine receptor 1 [Holothuria leucospilota]